MEAVTDLGIARLAKVAKLIAAPQSYTMNFLRNLQLDFNLFPFTLEFD